MDYIGLTAALLVTALFAWITNYLLVRTDPSWYIKRLNIMLSFSDALNLLRDRGVKVTSVMEDLGDAIRATVKVEKKE